jgi:hypothetical protein
MRKLILVLVATVIAAAACGRPSSQPPPRGQEPATAPATKVDAPPAPGVDGGGRTGPDATGTAWRDVVVPAGTQLAIRLDEAVGSDTSRVEDSVRATLVTGVMVDGVQALPAGSAVTGAVTNARRSGKVKGLAELAIRFDSVSPAGGPAAYRVRTGLVARRARTTHGKDALTIAAPAAGGAILGGLLGGKKGALIGTTVGGGAGTAVVLTTRGNEVRLPKGARLSIRLLEPVTVRVPA